MTKETIATTVLVMAGVVALDFDPQALVSNRVVSERESKAIVTEPTSWEPCIYPKCRAN